MAAHNFATAVALASIALFAFLSVAARTRPWARAGLVLSAVVVAGMRISGDTSIPFQAAAHGLVFLLFGFRIGSGRPGEIYLPLAIALTVVELACFLLGTM